MAPPASAQEAPGGDRPIRAVEVTGDYRVGLYGVFRPQEFPGDVIIVPGHTPHWFSELETDIEYLIFRPDPDNRIPLR